MKEIAAMKAASVLARAACAALALVAYTPPSHAMTPLSQVAAGGDTTCAIYLGAAYCWGANVNGQVGNNTRTIALSPAAVVGLDAGVTAITTGGAHSCAVVNGGAWCWGNNDYGQLGNNVGADSPVPVAVTGLGSGVTSISAGDLHTCAVVNGGVKCWGSGGYGQLGNGATTFSTAVPVEAVNLGNGIEEVSAGTNHTCASGSGFGYCWGRGDSGEVGSGGSTFINTNPVNVNGFGGTFGDIVSTIDGGGAFSCGVKDGNAYCWGFGGNGQIGNGFSNNAAVPQPLSTSMTGITAISAGTGLHACAVAGGAAVCWGANNQGQLGNPAFPGGSNVPVAVQGLASGVQRIAAGGLHTCAITDAGLSCWGDNANGQLGTGGQVPSPTPVLIFPAAVATALVASPATLDFGGQSVGTSTPAQVVTITNNGSTTVTFTNSAISNGFDGTTACASLVPGASCTLSVRFTPPGAGTRTGFAILETSAGLVGVDLAGVGELSLVTHYYRSILRRDPDAGGKAFWEGEGLRVSGLGADLNETWYAMALSFYNSAEYTAFGRDDNGFVTDLYNTFFNRAPDSGGLAYWSSNIAQGMPREVVLTSFMFSAEFANFTGAIFGDVGARPEVDTVVDFYRGLLGRLPDDGGFGYWRQQFRAAQCAGAAAVTAQAESISSQFVTGAEYAARGRTNAQYIGDLYNAFLRRGGDLAGVQYWIASLGTQTREQVRQAFVASPEFQARVQAVIAAGCLP